MFKSAQREHEESELSLCLFANYLGKSVVHREMYEIARNVHKFAHDRPHVRANVRSRTFFLPCSLSSDILKGKNFHLRVMHSIRCARTYGNDLIAAVSRRSAENKDTGNSCSVH